MNTRNNIPDFDSIKMLLGKYFDATISPMEMDRLESAARAVASGKADCPDHDIAEELQLINSISRYAEASLSNFTNNLPKGLEDRLNTHISMLAAKSASKERRPWVKRIVAYSAAAAVAGILAVGGYRYMQPTYMQPTSDNAPKQTYIMIADASRIELADTSITQSPASPLREQLGTSNIVAQGGSTQGSTKKSVKANAVKAHHRNAQVICRSNPTEGNLQGSDKSFINEADVALNAIPPFTQDALALSEEAFRVMPTGVTAYVETSNLLEQPISTLSQSINNIYESVEIVSEALSGVAFALQAVNNSLALLSNPI